MAQDRPTSELLRFLAEFYDSRNLISTANRLGKGSATCFRLLAQAREIFEDPLFVKSGRAMMPTPKMDSLIGEIQSILMRIDRLPSPKVFSPKNLTQDFRIGCIDNAALRFIVPSLRIFVCLSFRSMSIFSGRWRRATLILSSTHRPI